MSNEPWKPKRQTKIKYFGNFKGNLKHTRVQTQLNEFEDAAFLDIRQFQSDDEGDTFFHTGTGLSIHIKHLDHLERAVKKAKRIVEQRGLLQKYAKDRPSKKKKRKK